MSNFASMFNRVSDARAPNVSIDETNSNPLLECFEKIASMRGARPEEISALWFRARDFDKELSDNLILYVRDYKHGLGERRIGRILLKELSKIDPNKIIRNFETIVKIGRWDDLYTFIGTPVEGHMWQFFEAQLRADYEAAKNDKPISLLAKWAKSINTSSPVSRAIAKKTCVVLNLTEREYRKILSFLRARIAIVERKMSNNEWESIDFSKVPHLAMQKYKRVFCKRQLVPPYFGKLKKDFLRENVEVLSNYEWK